jgi:hypothetical protein
MNRRSFLALASGLLAPVPEPIRAYAFAPAGGWRVQASDAVTASKLLDSVPGVALEIDPDDFRHWIRGEDGVQRCPFTGLVRAARPATGTIRIAHDSPRLPRYSTSEWDLIRWEPR